jgi:integrase
VGQAGGVLLTQTLCGLRFGEMAALRVDRVDLQRRRLLVAESVTEVNGKAVFGTPKTHATRSIAFPGFLTAGLAERVEGRDPHDFVFPAPRGGVLSLRNWRRQVFDPAVGSAGLDNVSPHDLRHTAASLAVQAGGHVKAVQRMLGHSSAAMTLDVYSGLFDDDLDALAERLNDAAVPAARPQATSISADSAESAA